MENFDHVVVWIQRQYFQGVSVKHFDWGDLNNRAKKVDQELILKATCLHPLSKQYPPSDAYKLSYLKALLALYEDHGWKLCEEIYCCITDIITQKQNRDDSFRYKSYILPCGAAITLCESTQFLSQGTTGLNSWQAGFFLSHWLMKNKSILRGKNVLELGCGVGLAGLVALHCCRPKLYIFTDCHVKVLQKVQENLGINSFRCLNKVSRCNNEPKLQDDIETKECHCCTEGKRNGRNPRLDIQNEGQDDGVTVERIEGQRFFKECPLIRKTSQVFSSSNNAKICETCSLNGKRVDEDLSQAIVCQLDWENWTPTKAKQFSPDVILAADVIFDPSVIDSLVRVIKTFLSPEPHREVVAYVASTIRNKNTYEEFLSALVKSGIQRYSIEDAPDKMFFYQESDTELLKLEL